MKRKKSSGMWETDQELMVKWKEEGFEMSLYFRFDLPAIRNQITFFDLFEYVGEGLSVGFTSHLRVRCVSLIDPDLTLLVFFF